MMKPQALFLLFVATVLQAATPTSNAPFLKPDEAIAKMTIPDGFEVKAFVAEPDIGEAIAFCFDFKGRLWTLENYNYQTRRAHSTDKRNRIQIFEDVDGDGIEDAYDSDNDNDGYSDAEESAYGSDPLDANSVANAPPDNLFLSNLSILENLPAGAFMGKLSGSDTDGNASLSFARTPGPGSRDNALFLLFLPNPQVPVF